MIPKILSIRIYLFFLFLFLFFNNIILQAQWVQTNGPCGGAITCFTSYGNNIYAGTEGTVGEVFESTNGGINWLQINVGLNIPTVNALAVSGNNIFVGTHYGIYISRDNGISWIQVLAYEVIFSLAINGTNIFAGTFEGGIYLSTDNGVTWNQVNNGLTKYWVSCFAFSGNNIFAGTTGDAFLSTNNGVSWSPVGLGTDIQALAASGSYVYAGTSEGSVYQSADNGNHWSEVSIGLNNYEIYSLVVRGNYVWAGTFGGIYYLPYWGESWTQMNNGLDNTVIQSIIISGTSLLAGGNGVFRSTNDGKLWISSNNGLTASDVTSIAVKGDYIFSGADNRVHISTNTGRDWTQVFSGISRFNAFEFNDNNIFTCGIGVYMSTNNGMSWTSISNGFPHYEAMAIAFVNGNIFVGTTGAGAQISTNLGASWTKVSNGLDLYYVLSLCNDGNNIYAGTNGGVYRSSDEGVNWSQVNNGITNPGTAYKLAIGGLNIYVCSRDGIFLSTNKGDSWNNVNDSLNINNITSLAGYGDNIFVGSTNGIYLSKDNGINWTVFNDGLINKRILSLALDDKYIYAGTEGSGIWKYLLSDIVPVELTSFIALANNNSITLKWITATELNNSGFDIERSKDKTNWSKLAFIQGNQNSTTVISYSYEDKSLSETGKFYYRLKQIDNDGTYKYSNITETIVAPCQFSLLQNYPNPFNNTTIIKYSIPKNSVVKVIVFNALGEMVKQIVSGVEEAGYHEIYFDASSLPSGVYFYNIQTYSIEDNQNFTSTKKMVFLK